MCGDASQGLELAIGTPQPEGGDKPEPPAVAWLADFENSAPTAEEQAAFSAAEAVRDERIEALPLSTLTQVYSLSSFEWLRDREEALRSTADGLLVEALDVVAHDSVFIGAKVHRALDGRDRAEHNESFGDDPVQNDWNGSAKVALISVERSEIACQTIADAVSDPVAKILADQLADLRGLLIDAFPQAMAFVRPGFDEPWR